VIAQSPWRRDPELIEKQERIDRELERFLSEACPCPAAVPRDVGEILRFIHGHLFDSALNVTAVRQRCGLRNNNVSTRFRSVVGLGLREYIEILRLNAAERLLRCGGLEVYLVAMAVGYDHQETFCRAFQRQFGRTPSEQRLAALAPVREDVKTSCKETMSTHPGPARDIKVSR